MAISVNQVDVDWKYYILISLNLFINTCTTVSIDTLSIYDL